MNHVDELCGLEAAPSSLDAHRVAPGAEDDPAAMR